MAALVDTLRLLTQPELARGSDTKEIKKIFIQTGRGCGDGHRGGEDSLCAGGIQTGGVWDERGRQSEHWKTLQPHIRADKPRGPDPEWQRTGQAEQWVAPHGPTFTHR